MIDVGSCNNMPLGISPIRSEAEQYILNINIVIVYTIASFPHWHIFPGGTR